MLSPHCKAPFRSFPVGYTWQSGLELWNGFYSASNQFRCFLLRGSCKYPRPIYRSSNSPFITHSAKPPCWLRETVYFIIALFLKNLCKIGITVEQAFGAVIDPSKLDTKIPQQAPPANYSMLRTPSSRVLQGLEFRTHPATG